MNEGYYALTIALCAPRLLLPEDAWRALERGRMPINLPNRATEMVSMRKKGFKWKAIGETFGMSANTAQSCVCRLKKAKKGFAAAVPNP